MLFMEQCHIRVDLWMETAGLHFINLSASLLPLISHCPVIQITDLFGSCVLEFGGLPLLGLLHQLTPTTATSYNTATVTTIFITTITTTTTTLTTTDC